jgi:methionyl aminopeptidase
MIKIKNQREIELMREAGKMHAELMVTLRDYLAPGISTYEVEIKAREICKKNNIVPIQIGFFGYKDAICIGINNDAEHCVPSKTKIIKNGDIVTVDSAIKYNGYCSDGGFTLPIGKVDANAYKLINTTKLALDAAVNACIEGNTVNTISNAIYTIAKLGGFDVLKEFTGHGIGKDMHEDPYIHNYVRTKNSATLKAGMTLALDTMVTEGRGEVYLLDDGWSTKTTDGKRFAFFEYTVLVGKDKPEILNQF